MGKNKQQNNQYNQFTTLQLPDGWSSMSNQERSEWLINAQADTTGKTSKEEINNMFNYYDKLSSNDWSAEQETLAYERSKASNQVNLLMDAGMTRQAALSTLSGGSEQSGVQSLSSNANSSDAGIGFNDIVSAVGTGIDSLCNITNLGMNVAQFPLQLEQMRNAATLSKSNVALAENYVQSMQQSNAYASAVAAAQGMDGFDPQVNGATPAAYMDYFAQNADKSPHFKKFNDAVSQGLTGLAYDSINSGFNSAKNNEFIQNQMIQEANLRSINFDNVEQTLANAKEVFKGIQLANEQAAAELDVYREFGSQQASADLALTKSETKLNNAQVENVREDTNLTKEQTEQLRFENYLNSMKKKYLYTNDYFTTVTQAEHDRAVIYAAKMQACNSPQQLDHIVQQLCNDNAVHRYVTALQLYASESTFEQLYPGVDGKVTASKDFQKWARVWLNPAISNSMVSFYQAANIYENGLGQNKPGTVGELFNNNDAIPSPYGF